MPEISMTTDGMMVLLTAIIAAVTAALFIWQARQFAHERRVHNANYMLALFEHRMKVYSAIEDYLQDFLRDGGPTISSIVKLRWGVRNASFLLPDVSLNFANEIVAKGFDHHRASITWEPLRAKSAAGEILSENEKTQRDACVEKMHELEGWFIEQIEAKRLMQDFEPYLKLPDKL